MKKLTAIITAITLLLSLSLHSQQGVAIDNNGELAAIKEQQVQIDELRKSVEANRKLLKYHGFTSIWLESTFEHCWLNISFSRKDRPLARDKQTALKLFEERQKDYCLADWHFIVRPGFTSFDVAKKIVEEIFS